MTDLPAQPWAWTRDDFTGEVAVRDATGLTFLVVPAAARLVDARHAVGLVRREWDFTQAEALARLIVAAPALLKACKTAESERWARGGMSIATMGVLNAALDLLDAQK